VCCVVIAIIPLDAQGKKKQLSSGYHFPCAIWSKTKVPCPLWAGLPF